MPELMRTSYELTERIAAPLRPYVSALMNASRLNEFDATTCALFATTTYLDLAQYPILVFLGTRGSGKSAAMNQLYFMCKGAKRITGTTFATQRNQLENTRTAFLDEADIIDASATLIDLYTKRYLRETGNLQVNVPIPKRGCQILVATRVENTGEKQASIYIYAKQF
ncbi:hypothetical protein [Dehalococcoides mccartyi]|uniref:hypothetical protein n=1 Tax=Dehalococcoides mccartyi TaxID=61435 RepID=UPI0019F76D1B|nr:hypothetical protein [Dehalococcoides mccartyi]MBF4481858.1 hypothetical protein [Dehalococcoides mccartyi]MBJ7531214.1 hypothetical protein [Dehalococcoides mccartyi]